MPSGRCCSRLRGSRHPRGFDDSESGVASIARGVADARGVDPTDVSERTLEFVAEALAIWLRTAAHRTAMHRLKPLTQDEKDRRLLEKVITLLRERVQKRASTMIRAAAERARSSAADRLAAEWGYCNFNVLFTS